MSALSVLSTAEAADLFGISARTLGYAKRAIRNGSPKLVAALESGRISVWGAVWLADNADASVQDWVVERRQPIKRRLRVARRDPDMALRLALGTKPDDGLPRAVVIPVIRNVAVSAAQASSRATMKRGGKRS